jgi:hypothetical protein
MPNIDDKLVLGEENLATHHTDIPAYQEQVSWQAPAAAFQVRRIISRAALRRIVYSTTFPWTSSQAVLKDIPLELTHNNRTTRCNKIGVLKNHELNLPRQVHESKRRAPFGRRASKVLEGVGSHTVKPETAKICKTDVNC